MFIIHKAKDIALIPVSAFVFMKECATCCATSEDSNWGATAASERS